MGPTGQPGIPQPDEKGRGDKGPWARIALWFRPRAAPSCSPVHRGLAFPTSWVATADRAPAMRRTATSSAPKAWWIHHRAIALDPNGSWSQGGDYTDGMSICFRVQTGAALAPMPASRIPTNHLAGQCHPQPGLAMWNLPLGMDCGGTIPGMTTSGMSGTGVVRG